MKDFKNAFENAFKEIEKEFTLVANSDYHKSSAKVVTDSFKRLLNNLNGLSISNEKAGHGSYSNTDYVKFDNNSDMKNIKCGNYKMYLYHTLFLSKIGLPWNYNNHYNTKDVSRKSYLGFLDKLLHVLGVVIQNLTFSRFLIVYNRIYLAYISGHVNRANYILNYYASGLSTSGYLSNYDFLIDNLAKQARNLESINLFNPYELDIISKVIDKHPLYTSFKRAKIDNISNVIVGLTKPLGYTSDSLHGRVFGSKHIAEQIKGLEKLKKYIKNMNISNQDVPYSNKCEPFIEKNHIYYGKTLVRAFIYKMQNTKNIHQVRTYSKYILKIVNQNALYYFYNNKLKELTKKQFCKLINHELRLDKKYSQLLIQQATINKRVSQFKNILQNLN